MNNDQRGVLKHDIGHATIHGGLLDRLLLEYIYIKLRDNPLYLKRFISPQCFLIIIKVKTAILSRLLNFENLSRDNESFCFSIEDVTCNHPYGRRARRFLWLIYTRYRVAVYPVFRSTACRYKRRQLLLAASPVHPGVSLCVITMVCGLSSWLQVQYHFHNDTYPSPASARSFILSRPSRRKKKDSR